MGAGDVAGLTPNSILLIQGILRVAKEQPDPAAYLKSKHAQALEAVMAGDEFITSANSESGGSAAMRNMTAVELLQLYEACLQAYEAEQAAESSGMSGPGSVRGADFSQYPCTLG